MKPNGDFVAQLGSWDHLDLTISRHKSREGAVAIAFSPRKIIGQVLHFHGGPDAYEVEELRFFGAFRSLLKAGVETIALNYQGSSGIGYQHQKAGWRRWHQSFTDDLDWLVENGLLKKEFDVITAGWSFGGTLAFIASQYIDNAKAAVIGGAMTDLSAHIKRAINADHKYKVWFERRFGPIAPNSDALAFFRLENHLHQEKSVLSFHGKNDPHCAYEDLIHLRELAATLKINWKHFDLPGGDHYATSIADAILIHQEFVRFSLSLFAR